MNEMQVSPELEAQKSVVVSFSWDLVARQFNNAHQRLAKGLAKELSPDQLEILFDEVIGHFETDDVGVAVEAVELVDQDNQWCWYYVPLEGDGELEALTVAVNYLDPSYCIEDIEWGRF